MASANMTVTTSTTENDECNLTAEAIQQAYNLTLRIVSVFVLLIVSFIGASLSVVSARVKALRIHPVILNVGKFFGSGVVLATGFIHILPDAMETLTDPCLPDSWNNYSAYAGLFAMLAALAMQLMEFLAHQRFRSIYLRKRQTVTPSHAHDHPPKPAIEHKAGSAGDKPQASDGVVEFDGTPQASAECEHEAEPHHVDIVQMGSPMASLDTHAHSAHHHHHHGIAFEDGGHHHHHNIASEDGGHHHHHGIAFEDDGQHHKVSTYLLEFGVAVHSVLIGLTLGTTSESFVALFIALCFHQFFEAIALGSQIAGLKTASIKAAIGMVLFFSFTTPVGIAIGIGIHSGTYNPKSVSSLLVTGILDSLSAGILIYVALVNLITAEMGVNAHSFHSLSTRLKFLYFIALYLGAALMAVIGRWA